ncbi:MAG: phosphate acyltransferase PlsX [Pseudomonadota bacterium]|nr:phosphate acyltransferase PlsX [Pseudomonadota bacterium]
MLLALDAMGGDHGPAAVVPAAVAALRQHPDLHLILVGREEALEKVLASYNGVRRDRLAIRHSSQEVGMDEAPSQALRTKKDSSMRVAIDLVKAGAADACVSAGNTGALVATARFVLKMLPGIERPAICSAMPAATRGHSRVLDLGANVDSTPEQLLQFALMGVALTSAVDNKPAPSVALLNVGVEEIKGHDQVKGAAALLAQSNLNYVGFVEGDDIYEGAVDVIVCDGFVGNIALKASEGVARMLMRFARDEFLRTPLSRLAAWVSKPVLRAVMERLDPRQYNGASLLGLRGIVIKSHGGADAISFANAIEEAMLEVKKGVPERISGELQVIFDERRAV